MLLAREGVKSVLDGRGGFSCLGFLGSAVYGFTVCPRLYCYLLFIVCIVNTIDLFSIAPFGGSY
ncbi:hypothetical protein C8J57DRAFT_1334054 [Mycena rebaudengoi]